MEPTPAIQAFNDQLLRCSQELETGARSEVEKKLWEEYGAETTVLIVDMSGFTKLTDSHGVVHYLSMVRRMQLTAELKQEQQQDQKQQDQKQQHKEVKQQAEQ